MDASTLAAHTDLDDAQAMRRGGVALANVAAITALDVYTARNWQEPERPPVYDYRDRIGMGQSPEQMRGLARKDFEVPRDMRTPEALRPWTTESGQARLTPAVVATPAPSAPAPSSST